jgi:hypothetical protein
MQSFGYFVVSLGLTVLIFLAVLNMGDDKSGVRNETSLYNEPQNNGDLPPEPSISVAFYTRLNNGEPVIE